MAATGTLQIEKTRAPAPRGAHELAHRAISRARELKRDVLLRALYEVPIADPIRHAGRNLVDEPGMLWRDGRTGMSIAALGLDQRLAPRGGSFDAASTAIDEVRETLVQGWLGSGQPALTELPLCLGAFSFRQQTPHNDDPWSDWPRAELIIPERMLVQWAGTPTLAVTSTRVAPDDDEESVLARIDSSLTALLSQRPATRRAVNGIEAQRDWRLGEGRERWSERIAAARHAFETSTLEKVVLARRAHFFAPKGTRFDPLATLERLRESHPDSFVFGLTAGDGRWFLGATPELLARASTGRVDTHALAGTIASSPDDEEAKVLAAKLRASMKDRREQALVTEAIQAALGRHCTRLEVTPEPRVLRLTGLQHLETTLSGILERGRSVLDLVNDLHPTPAVGGHPRDEALSYLAQTEDMHRGYYASPIGWVGTRGEGCFAVALRSALVYPKEATAYVGAGIVRDSRAEAEWEETELKLQTVAAGLVLQAEGHD